MNSSPDTGDKSKIASSRVSDHLTRGFYHTLVVKCFSRLLFKLFSFLDAPFNFGFNPLIERGLIGYRHPRYYSVGQAIAQDAAELTVMERVADFAGADCRSEFVIYVHFVFILIKYPNGHHPRGGKSAIRRRDQRFEGLARGPFLGRLDQ